jgi:hypothetical protein
MDLIPSFAWFEPPDVYVAHPVRPPTAEESERVLAFLRERADRVGGLFAIVDLSEPVQVTNLKGTLEVNKHVPAGMIRATAIIHASFQNRIAVEAVLRAMRLLGLDTGRVPIRFLTDKAAALAWFDALRASP